MANASKDNLFVLISSLSKSEKRQFKLYVNRLGVNVDAKFLLLFNLLDKMNDYNEEDILKKLWWISMVGRNNVKDLEKRYQFWMFIFS